ncbi:MAG: ImmA/IrrE family metallo-endopeptidase [Brevibacterium sp.]|nr:ImmA/IrrE family metallo-endopeptidase [Brevibacterium sp.]
MHHPWRELRERGDGVVLHFTRFNDTRVAATNGNNAIWLDQDLLQVERRCAIQHEQAHIDLGHTNCDDPREEQAARRLTAQKLIAWDALVDVFKWAHNALEAADELWVTPEVLGDRLRFLHPHEKGLLALIGATRHG